MKLLLVVGTRPNFVKVTQFKNVAAKYFKEFEIKLVHTGQHYDHNMSDAFFDQFDLRPDYFLECGGGTPVYQMAQIMISLEKLIKEEYQPDCILVPGDVNSTLAVAMVANKMNIPLAHIESGLRSFDRKMPEEHNRILTDEISNICFVTEPSGLKNLEREQNTAVIHHVGNTMIDTLVAFEDQIAEQKILETLNLQQKQYVLMTMHRPSNVDNKENLSKLMQLLDALKDKAKVVFPIHPRTLKNIEAFGMLDALNAMEHLVCPPPMAYFEFQKLIKDCLMVITDSGGIQEETTFRGVPCLTLRENTERPVTVDMGTNTIVPLGTKEMYACIEQVCAGGYKTGKIPQYWDGKATLRILESFRAQ